jgi:peptidoglycan/LPS O-acetylase OafA/YrhL
MQLPSAGAFYYRGIPALSAEAIAAHSSVRIFLGNLLFLQSIYFPSFGSDLPLWSLSYEFWYYLLFPILLIVLVARSTLAKRLAFALAGSAIILMLGRNITLMFLVWLAGAGVGLLHDMRPKLALRTSAAWSTYCYWALGLVVLVVAKLNLREGLASDFAISAAFLPVMYALVEARGSTVNRAYASTAKVLSSFSYSLYVAHLPLLIFLRTLLGQVPRWQLDFTHAAFGAALAGVVATYSFGISRLTEARTDAVRRILLRKLQSKRVAVPCTITAQT